MSESYKTIRGGYYDTLDYDLCSNISRKADEIKERKPLKETPKEKPTNIDYSMMI